MGNYKEISRLIEDTPEVKKTDSIPQKRKRSEREQQKLEEMLKWRRLLHERIIDEMDLRRKDVHNMTDDQLRVETETLVNELMEHLESEIPELIDKEQLHRDVLNEAIGLGPLEELLADDSSSYCGNRANHYATGTSYR